ncbi:MAG: redox-regulated ATPase YchF [Patescibacteria group bacterium]|nr:redox-regulated ATPase YchF [Patescibacteria group bacterium]MDE2590789.1 redox-regulated ATPase YchF [Patescibacteria group bacterium]
MNLSVGIVGLPNVGKSTLFNALLKKQQALAANYPFATIEPNVGIVPVPDQRLQKLAEITRDEEKMSELPPIKPATVEFVDIAGLVKGAAEGAGLGNKFLSHIREVGIIAHVVRVFEDENIIKEGAVNPKEDYETINMELMLADVQTLQKAAENRKADPIKRIAAQKALDNLNNSIPVRLQQFTDEELEVLHEYFLLSGKQEIVVLNVSETTYNPEGIKKVIAEYSSLLGIGEEKCVVICAKIESDLSELSEAEQKEYLRGLGLESSGLERLIQKAYGTLGLISFLTCGEKEVRAWTTKKGISAQLAAGEIHTDFIKKFIRAEIVAYEDFVANSGWKGSREHGKARLEGKEYTMHDGDVVEFKIGS